MNKKQGILLIATKHPNYGTMAYNLALSIKSVEDIPIAVIFSGPSLSYLNEDQLRYFDYKIDLPDNSGDGFGTKLHLDQLTPFDKTLCLDVDMLWLGKKPSELFASLDGVQFTCITEGNTDDPNKKYYFWAEPKEIQQLYKVNKIWQTRSEVMYFEDGTKVFEVARSLIPQEKLSSIRMFGKNIPDELYFNIAIAMLKVDPHIPKWQPAYWCRLHNELMPNLSILYRDFYLLSLGSNAASPIMKRAYDNIMRIVCNKTKVPYMFKLKSKKEWAPDRLKI